MNGASVCVCAMFSVDLGNRNEISLKRKSINWKLGRGQDDINPYFLVI